MTIGTNYRSGSAIVATTQETDEVWTVPLWPSSMNNKRNQQCLRSHRYDANTGRGQQESDSAIVAIRDNKQQTERSLNRRRSGYWSTGAGKWIDRVNMTIDHQLQQESTVPLWPSTTITDSAIVAIGTIHSQQRQCDHWRQPNGQRHCGHPQGQQTTTRYPLVGDSQVGGKDRQNGATERGYKHGAEHNNLLKAQEWETVLVLAKTTISHSHPIL
jgi:hypothetical protein